MLEERTFRLLKERDLVTETGEKTDKLFEALGLTDGVTLLLDGKDSESPLEKEETELLTQLLRLYANADKVDDALDCIRKLFRNHKLQPAVDASAAEEEKKCYTAGFVVTCCLLPEVRNNSKQLWKEAYNVGYEDGFEDGANNDEEGEDTE